MVLACASVALVLILFLQKQQQNQSNLKPLTVAPQIHPFDFGDEPINSAELVTVSCSVIKGDLPVEIAWLHDNKSVSDDVNVVKISKKVSTLTIESVQAHHSGTYTCLVRNSAGSAAHSAELQVNG